jgi:hypothetical protein
MANYNEKVAEVMGLFNEAGAILLKEGSILGYGATTDRVHHTISNDTQGDWGEYPVAYAFYKFGDNSNPRFVILSATLDKEVKNLEGMFSFAHEVKERLPNFSEYLLKPHKDRGEPSFWNARNLADIINIAIRGE